MRIIETFGERLSELLSQNDKITTDKLGETLDIGGSTIRCWLENRNSPLLSNAITIADYFNCSLDFLCGRSETIIDFAPKPAPPFYQRLLAVLDEYKITRYKLIKEKIVPQTNFIGWSRGADPHLYSLIDIADYLEITLDYLVGRE